MSVEYEYPFAQIPLWIHEQGGSKNAVFVYYGLCKWVNHATKTCHPSKALIAQYLGMDEKTVTRGIQELEDLGAITTIRRYDDAGRQTTNDYVLHVAPGGQNGGATRGPEIGGEEGDTGVPQTIYRKNYIQKNYNSSPRAKDADHPEFADFWKAYPRKQSRGQAVKSHKQAIRRVDASVILDAVRLQAKTEGYRLARAPKYIPLASTWLNGDGWLDEPEASEVKPSSDLFSKYGV